MVRRVPGALIAAAALVVRRRRPVTFGAGGGLPFLAVVFLSTILLVIVRSASAAPTMAMVTVFMMTASIALLPRISMRPMGQSFAASLPATLPLGRDRTGTIPTALLG